MTKDIYPNTLYQRLTNLERKIKAMKYNFDNLVSLIDEKSPDGTINYFLNEMGWDYEDFIYRITNAKEWTEEEIEKACDALLLDESEIPLFFKQIARTEKDIEEESTTWIKALLWRAEIFNDCLKNDKSSLDDIISTYEDMAPYINHLRGLLGEYYDLEMNKD